MKSIIYFLMCFFCAKSLAQNLQELQIKSEYDLKIEIVEATFGPKETLADAGGNNPYINKEEKISCQDQIFIKIRITNDGRKDAYSVPINCEYFVSGNKVKDLKLFNSSEEITYTTRDENGMFTLFKQLKLRNPYTPLVHNSPSLLDPSTETVPRIRWLWPGEKMEIIVTAPFQYSTIDGLEIGNTYKFKLGETFFGETTSKGIKVKTRVKDKLPTNNISEVTYWKACKTDDLVYGDTFFEDYYFDGITPEILETKSGKRIVNKLFPNPVVITGQLLTVDINTDIDNPRDVETMIIGIETNTQSIMISPNQFSPNGHQFNIVTDELKDGLYQVIFNYPGWDAQSFKLLIYTKKL